MLKITHVAALIAALTVAIPSSAQAHTITKRDCSRIAMQQVELADKVEAFKECVKLAKQHNLRHQCSKPRPLISARATVKGVSIQWRLSQKGSSHQAREHRWYGKNQRHVLTWIINEGRARKLPPKLILTAIATTTQEASAIELRGGDWTSAGPFQLTHYHGTLKQRRTVEFSANWFYNHVVREHRKNPHRSINDLAQAVQRSGRPYAYAQHVREAERTYKIALGRCPR